MYYAIPPNTKVAEKLVEFFLREMEDFKRSHKPHTKAELRHNRDIRQAAKIMKDRK